MIQSSSGLGSALAAATLISFLPMIAVVATCYTKITVVLLIVRNAIGVQQTPPNLLLFAVAVILSVFIMMPVLDRTWTLLSGSYNHIDTPAAALAVAKTAAEPLKAFMVKYTEAPTQAFFDDAAKKIWGDVAAINVSDNDLAVLVPSFLVSELTRAFRIGFLIYLPFLMIDFAVSAILVALGMSQMSPTVVSTPFKLLLFVAVDGWRRLLEGLILSYAGT